MMPQPPPVQVRPCRRYCDVVAPRLNGARVHAYRAGEPPLNRLPQNAPSPYVKVDRSFGASVSAALPAARIDSGTAMPIAFVRAPRQADTISLSLRVASPDSQPLARPRPPGLISVCLIPTASVHVYVTERPSGSAQLTR